MDEEFEFYEGSDIDNWETEQVFLDNEGEDVSECCSVPFDEDIGICSECGEHCEGESV